MEELKWWFEDNWKVVVAFLSIVGVVGLTMYMFYVEADRTGQLPDSYEEQIETVQTNSEEIKETFSLLDQIETSMHDGQTVYEISLYNKKPFMSPRDLEGVLRKYIEAVEIVDGTYDVEVRGIKFNLYDRKIKFDMGAKPDGVYYYGIPYTSLPDSEKEDVNSRYYSMSPQEVAYDYTTLYAPTNLDKSTYSLYGSYKQLRRVAGIEPMTDQEYNWYVKLDMYTTLGADSGSLYLEWELGAPKSGSVSRLFRQDVRSFRQRLTALGDDTTIFGRNSITEAELKRHLVIENPSFLLYAETGKLEENAIRARALLVEENPGDYQRVVEDWVRTLAEDQIRQMEQGEDPATSGVNNQESFGGFGEEDAPSIGGINSDPNGNIDSADSFEEDSNE